MKPISAQPSMMKRTVRPSAVYCESARNGIDRRGEDQEPAHRRRPLLHDMGRGPFRADLLSEVARAEHVDEPRPDHDGGDHRDQARDQDGDHARAKFVISSAMPSSPTARDALTRTASPGSSSARATSTASAASSAHATGS